MIAVASEQLFQDFDQTPLALMAVLQACADGRHILLTAPLWTRSAVVNGWVARLPGGIQQQVRHIFERGVEANAQAPSSTFRIKIAAVSQPQWANRVPVLDVDTALRVMTMPLRLIVENRINDAAFVRKVLPLPAQKTLRTALQRGWVEFEHGGGIEEMAKRVADLAQDPVLCARGWLMFDSDARAPDEPSASSAALEAACRAVAVPGPLRYHRLRRRSIENYIPAGALATAGHRVRAWMKDVDARQYQRTLAAYKRLGAKAHYYNMKAGLEGDLGQRRKEYRATGQPLSDDDLPPLFRGLPREDKEDLRTGFGSDVANLFHDDDEKGVEFVREADVQVEVSASEREALMMSLFEGM